MFKQFIAVASISLLLISCDNKTSKPTEEVKKETTPIENTISEPVDMDSLATDEPPIPKDFKIGHVYSQQLLTLMPSYKSGMKKLERDVKAQEAELQRQMQEYQRKEAALMQESKDLPQSVLQSRAGELQMDQQRIATLQQNAQNRIIKAEEKFMQPIMAKIDAAIKKIAERDQYSYIWDGSKGGFVYGLEVYDITPEVRKELGI